MKNTYYLIRVALAMLVATSMAFIIGALVFSALYGLSLLFR